MDIMMECGHAAQVTNAKTGAPACFTCRGIHPGAEIVATNPPDLTTRRARCTYYGGPTSTAHRRANPDGPPCAPNRNGGRCECGRWGEVDTDGSVPSAPRLPFFGHKPDAPFDTFYCGCFGWD